MSTPVTGTVANPYVGPRTFAYEDRHFYFGREREARSLLARAVSERLLLFYAQSGAGKSSLINTRLIPGLAEEEGFAVLPVGRVGGDLPIGLEVDNIYAFNLMASLDRSGTAPGRLAGLTITVFLANLVSDDGLVWRYDPAPQVESGSPSPGAGTSDGEPHQRFALVIDQFEEIITSHPDRWREREDFFRQLDQALQANPDLWVVLTLREDYLAALDPYAPLLFNRLRARFYMERMGVEAGLDAIRKPAELAGRPFASSVAERLAVDLRQVRVPGQKAPIAGQYVEPVQLQVACYQLWENIKGRPLAPITAQDLAEVGDVDRALTQFYEETLVLALADPAAAGISERQLRTWFDQELITEAGTRGLVRQDADDTGGMANSVVKTLQRRFMVRGEARGGDTWIELVHDRFVEPIRASNAAWFPLHLSTLQRQASLWDEHGRSSGLLLRDAALAEAEAWAAGHVEELQSGEKAFLAACRDAQEATERERRRSRAIRILAVVAGVVAILAIAAAIWGWDSSRKAAASAADAERQKQVAEDNAHRAVTARATADASTADAVAARGIAQENLALAEAQLMRQLGLAFLQEAYALKKQGDALGAIEQFHSARDTQTDLGVNVEAEIEDVRRQVATQWVQEGEARAKTGDFPAAEARFKAALALEPPPDTPVYVYVPAGAFVMGSEIGDSDERPTHAVSLDSYWIQRTEVTNAQYWRCVEAKGCQPPDEGNVRYRNPQFMKQPVSGVTWFQAQEYASWVGGRLPTEAEWEKACRGPDGLIYPWGDTGPTEELLNFLGSGLGTWSTVGSYPKGSSPYGVLDLAGNVREWIADWYDPVYPTDSHNQNPVGPPDGSQRVWRGGSFRDDARLVRCADRNATIPAVRYGLDNFGFRVVVAPDF